MATVQECYVDLTDCWEVWDLLDEVLGPPEIVAGVPGVEKEEDEIDAVTMAQDAP